MRNSVFVSFFSVIAGLSLAGQEPCLQQTEGDLFLKLNNINFVRNNEYSNPIIEGYTLIGYFLQPEVIYKADEKLAVSLGANLLSYSGTDRFVKTKPVFSTTFSFSDSTFFRIGTLTGSDEHRLQDPHFNRERLYTNYAEDGLQFRTMGKRFFSDTWLSWENFIFRGDNEREIFTAGESFRYSLPPITRIINVEVPFQLLIKHYGGQISDYEQKVETLLNMAIGIRAGIDAAKSGDSMAGIECMYFSGNSLTKNSPWEINEGHAGWYKLFGACKNASLEAGYWHSDNYYAPDGNFIFSSVSDHIEDLVISERNLITGSFSLTLPWKDKLELTFGFDGFYDTDLRRFDNAMTMHLRFGKLFKIASLRKG
ncbi:MAG TPA: hypothetical protein PLX08_06460 [Bacteroidales bacterium]|jgi:hypothetical protein|nr:hypothetical protein [Bacteroidales bacterium]